MCLVWSGPRWERVGRHVRGRERGELSTVQDGGWGVHHCIVHWLIVQCCLLLGWSGVSRRCGTAHFGLPSGGPRAVWGVALKLEGVFDDFGCPNMWHSLSDIDPCVQGAGCTGASLRMVCFTCAANVAVVHQGLQRAPLSRSCPVSPGDHGKGPLHSFASKRWRWRRRQSPLVSCLLSDQWMSLTAFCSFGSIGSMSKTCLSTCTKGFQKHWERPS